ncbi:MAG: chemotaxis protein CheW [Deltaproteobacteria bacterium]|nr:chemotaxis protein CheW [Deltaproteobacteria bacterium]
MEAGARPCLLVAVEGERFGIDTERIRTVVEYRRLTPIPGRPRPFVGALNHHGELLPVVALASLLGRKARLDRDRSAIVVLDWEDAVLGLLVERTHGLLTASDRARPARVLGRWDGPHLAQTLELEGQRVHVLDVDSLLADVARRL